VRDFSRRRDTVVTLLEPRALKTIHSQWKSYSRFQKRTSTYTWRPSSSSTARRIELGSPVDVSELLFDQLGLIDGL
jgi:hypothetical protein